MVCRRGGMWLDVWRHVLGSTRAQTPSPPPPCMPRPTQWTLEPWQRGPFFQTCHRHPTLGRRVCACGAIFCGRRGPRSNRRGRSHPEQPLAEHAGHGPRSCRAGVWQRGHPGPPRMDCHEPPRHRRGPTHPSRPVRRLHHGSRVDWKRPKHGFGPPQDHADRRLAHTRLWQFRRSECRRVGACGGQPT